MRLKEDVEDLAGDPWAVIPGIVELRVCEGPLELISGRSIFVSESSSRGSCLYREVCRVGRCQLLDGDCSLRLRLQLPAVRH